MDTPLCEPPLWSQAEEVGASAWRKEGCVDILEHHSRICGDHREAREGFFVRNRSDGTRGT